MAVLVMRSLLLWWRLELIGERHLGSIQGRGLRVWALTWWKMVLCNFMMGWLVKLLLYDLNFSSSYFSFPFSFLIIYIHENMVCGGFHQMWVLGIRLGEGEHWILIGDTGKHSSILAMWIMQQVAVNCRSCQAFPEFVEVCVTFLEWVSHILVYWCHVFEGWWFGI